MPGPHHPIFDRYEPWSGEVDGGWSANFLGVRTRDVFTAGMAGVVASERRGVETGYPAFDEEYFEWVDVLEAVAAATGTFTMIELGAGWGRWLMNGAVAAQRDGLSIHLVGVEAEPTHFGWMQQHFRDNGVDPASLKLIQAAVAAEAGRVRFHVGDPDAWYGQAIEPGQPAPAPEPSLFARIRRFLDHRPPRERAVIEVRAVSLLSILEGEQEVDLIDLDVQGSEADVLEAADDMLSKKVKRVHVGTHSEENESRLRSLFVRLGWEKLNDYPCGAEAETDWGRISFQDGVQTWLNPGLAPQSRSTRG
jgi:FkbM family methyltransferase